MNTNKQGNPVYPSSLKIAIARDYLTSNLGYGALAKKYDLALQTVVYFVRWYRRHYPTGNAVADQKMANDPAKTASTKELEKQLKEANLKIAGLEMLIEIAKKELGIDIVKKPGTKQSPK